MRCFLVICASMAVPLLAPAPEQTLGSYDHCEIVNRIDLEQNNQAILYVAGDSSDVHQLGHDCQLKLTIEHMCSSY